MATFEPLVWTDGLRVIISKQKIIITFIHIFAQDSTLWNPASLVLVNLHSANLSQASSTFSAINFKCGLNCFHFFNMHATYSVLQVQFILRGAFYSCCQHAFESLFLHANVAIFQFSCCPSYMFGIYLQYTLWVIIITSFCYTSQYVTNYTCFSY